MSGRRDDERPAGAELDHAVGEDGGFGAAGTEPGMTDLIGQLLREEPELATALEALSAGLDHVELPAGAWERLAAELTVLGPAAGSATSPFGTDTPPEAAAPGPVVDAPSGRGTGHAPSLSAGSGVGRSTGRATAVAGRGRGGPRPRWNWAHPLTWLATAVVVAAVVGLGTWGAVQTGERARLVEEQRVLSYWMANPDMRMVALREIGSAGPVAGEGPAGRLGVVCILPDGRALLLQPNPAGRGQSYVVLSRGAGAEIELGTGTGNVIRFDLAGAERVVVMLSSGGERVPIAWADVN